MTKLAARRHFLKQAGGAAALAFFPSITKALAIPAERRTGTIEDVKHVVILMQENRSFDHYFGTMRGVRGFGDRHTVPLEGGRAVWQQSDGEKIVTPFPLDTRNTSALRMPMTPHSFPDAQAAWSQGKFGRWAKYKTAISMGHYRRADIPFQFALAEAFTICDGYFCSIQGGTDPNRIVLFSGSNYDPRLRAEGRNCTDKEGEPVNQRCWVSGRHPDPGYIFKGSDFEWPTIPDILEQAGIDWRIWQDPNDNYSGLMHGGLAFRSFRRAQPGSAVFERGMTHHSLEALKRAVVADKLPQVSWVLPPADWSEHPYPSSSLQGAEFTAKVLGALTANPKVWAKTVLFLTFDENDGQFDHVPPPAPPSYDAEGVLAGGATLNLSGYYFDDHDNAYRDIEDEAGGPLRPWGLGPRVPMYVISPWSRGGWVNSQVFDHTSIGQFLERRFGIVIPAISPWHRAVCGDLTSAFDFHTPNVNLLPALPQVAHSTTTIRRILKRPPITPPVKAKALFQEAGVRRSRALPYRLEVLATVDRSAEKLTLRFVNTGSAGAVFHVYDRLHLTRIPRRYTVEAAMSYDDTWGGNNGVYDLLVLGPNGFVRALAGRFDGAIQPEIAVDIDSEARCLLLRMNNPAGPALDVKVHNLYGSKGKSVSRLRLPYSKTVQRKIATSTSGGWYDVAVSCGGFLRHFAGRIENGKDSISDPAMHTQSAGKRAKS